MLVLLLTTTLLGWVGAADRVVYFENYGDTVTLDCTETAMNRNMTGLMVRYWQLPQEGDAEPRRITVYVPESTPWVESDGWQLKVGGIVHAELGTYTCVWTDGSTDREEEVEVKYREPSQWSLYKDNVTVGLICTFAFIVLLIAVFLVWYFRWQDPDKAAAVYKDDQSYENMAYHSSAARPDNSHVITINKGDVHESRM